MRTEGEKEVMLPIRKVLVPIDFSEPSKEAFQYGLSLAIELKAELVLGHVIPFAPAREYAYPVEGRHVTEAEIDQVRSKLESWVDAESRQFLEPRVVVKAGDVKDGVLALVSEEAPDLVVMGTHGRRRFERWFLGSVTEYILRKAVRPILTVSHLDSEHALEKPQPIPLRKLLYATDLSEVADRALEFALVLAHEFSAQLIVLHALPDLGWAYGMEYVPLDLTKEKTEAREAVFHRLVSSVPESARRDPRVRIELQEGRPAETILRFADGEDVDMIVLNTQSRSGLDRALLGSTAERVVRGAHVPVLSVPPGVKQT
jgi:nucleotide-binding universal stress UspA family protein